jgi:hypothetical protein
LSTPYRINVAVENRVQRYKSNGWSSLLKNLSTQDETETAHVQKQALVQHSSHAQLFAVKYESWRVAMNMLLASGVGSKQTNDEAQRQTECYAAAASNTTHHLPEWVHTSRSGTMSHHTDLDLTSAASAFDCFQKTLSRKFLTSAS